MKISFKYESQLLKETNKTNDFILSQEKRKLIQIKNFSYQFQRSEDVAANPSSSSRNTDLKT